MTSSHTLAQALKQPGPPRPKKEVPEVTQYKLPGYQTPVIKHSKPHLTTKKPYAPKKENSGPPVPKSSYQPPGYKEAEKKEKEKKKTQTPFKTQSGMSFHRELIMRIYNCVGRSTFKCCQFVKY